MISRDQFIQAGAQDAIVGAVYDAAGAAPPATPAPLQEYAASVTDPAEQKRLEEEVEAEIHRRLGTLREMTQAILDGAAR